MWGKDAQVRIDETKTYICGLYPAGDRQTIRTYLDQLISGMFNNADLQKAFSAELSTHGFQGRGDADTRAQRRALVILRGSLLLNTASALFLKPDQVMRTPAGQIPGQLAAVREGFHIWAMQEQNHNGPLQNAFNSLTANPLQFLQNNLVVCQSTGAAPGAAINHTFLYDYKNQYFQMIPQQQIGPQGQQQAGYLKPAHIAGLGLVVQAINVPETYWADVPGRGAVPLGHGAGTFAQIAATQLIGANLMVTSAFSGCSFCFKQNGAGTFAAHISPATPDKPTIGGPPTLANQLNANGNFGSPPNAAAGALRVYGRGFANIVGQGAGYAVDPVQGVPLVQLSMYVFGINNGGWRFYAQQNQMGAKAVTQFA